MQSTSKSPVTNRAFNIDYAQHENLLHKFARAGFGRLQAAGVQIEYLDVFGEMCVHFSSAQKKWNPDVGVSFTAYMGRSIWNGFNKYAEREIRRAIALGEVSLEALDDAQEQDGGYSAMDSLLLKAGSFGESPEDGLIRKQEIQRRIRSLSRTAKEVVLEMIAPTPLLETNQIQLAAPVSKVRGSNPVKRVADQLGLDPARYQSVRAELKRLEANAA